MVDHVQAALKSYADRVDTAAQLQSQKIAALETGKAAFEQILIKQAHIIKGLQAEVAELKSVKASASIKKLQAEVAELQSLKESAFVELSDVMSLALTKNGELLVNDLLPLMAVFDGENENEEDTELNVVELNEVVEKENRKSGGNSKKRGREKEEKKEEEEEEEEEEIDTTTAKIKKSKAGTSTSEVVRDEKRRALPAHDCEECKKFYDAICDGNSEFNKSDLMKHCGRHRSKFTPDMTPEGFWEMSFTDEVQAREIANENE
ncbi:hypothetical protein ScalyP_jg7264 [Parmales sp. scaly parma]|nr:hypothetical protein ScalyP_jg7264 [Parmales sp. scaly parma]